ncbi:putative sulfate exporter family transporter [Undibacterium sp. CY7W]|uniref:Sulfate exporter family transporter n=1 Tax=Undibacterium rugosum TaxID=2762291 RepID=A0A923HYQ3_9BURK|nr:putative sulfate exporter family transporter [Undibacterium rugosum]MBC3934619.1 putative sulfate exporter family transporter [Undibacterium rugosum]
MRKMIQTHASGLLLSLLMAAVSLMLAQSAPLQSWGLGSLTLAILLGLILGNLPLAASRAHHWEAGLQFSKQQLLRAGIVLYGLRLSLHDIGNVGLPGLLVDLLMLISTLWLAAFLGSRVFRLPRELTLLIGAGSAICGAAAILAAAPVLRSKEEDTGIAISGVVFFGTCSMLLYPLFFQSELLLSWSGLTPAGIGIYTGATLHEVAQVVVAGKAMTAQIADVAIVTKMMRVMLLAPVLCLLAWLVNPARQTSTAGSAGWRHSLADVSIPWFAILFVVVILMQSALSLPSALRQLFAQLDQILLSAAMFALGFSTRLASLRKAGWKPLLLAGSIWCWLILGGLLISQLIL